MLDVDRQSDLTFPGGYTQSVFEAVGKNTDKEGKNEIMAPAQGTIIVTTKGGSTADYDHGAHMALVAIWVRPVLRDLSGRRDREQALSPMLDHRWAARQDDVALPAATRSFATCAMKPA